MTTTVTFGDKGRFLLWATDTHRLSGGELTVLQTIVLRLLGLEDGKSHNAWTTTAVLANACGLRRRAVQRALDRLVKLGLLKRVGVPGRGGRTLLHVPEVAGAAKRLKLRPLGAGDGEAGTEAGDAADVASKRRRAGHLKPDEKASPAASKRCRAGHLNPLNESIERNHPCEGARVDADAEPPDGGKPSALFEMGEEEGRAFGQEEWAESLTRPRERLRKRLTGVATKIGLQDGGAALLRSATEATVGGWLRLQREGKDTRLVQELHQALMGHYGLPAEETGRRLATKAEPEPESRAAPAAPAPPSPSQAPASSPLPPTAATVRRAPPLAALRTVQAAIRQPEPPPRLQIPPDELRASAARLAARLAMAPWGGRA
jgi:DNA-binding MarR family transcriptional regulator